MKTLFTILTLMFVITLNAQKTPIGFAVEFEEGTDLIHQREALQSISGLKALDTEMMLEGFDVSLVLLDEFTESSSIFEIQDALTALRSVSFCSILYKSQTGVYAAKLSEIILQPKTTWSEIDAKNFEKKYGFQNVYKYSGLTNCWRLTFDKKLNINYEGLVSELKSTDDYLFVCQNMLYTLEACTNDPYLANQWALENDGSAIQYNGTIGADMEVVSAWTMNTGENYIKVAVLDSGTDTNHVDLVGNLLPGFDATGGGSKGYPNTTYSNDGHGTCTAGIIAARGDNSVGIAGVSYDCKVIPVKIFYYVNLGAGVVPFTTSTAGTDGIIWAIDTAKADILSNSWGLRDADIATLGIDTTMGNAVISQKIATGRYGKGAPMLFSSGNEGDPFSIWPASHPKTISVGASTMCDKLKTTNDCSPENWWGSNHGADLDIMAPGVKVLTTDMTGSLGYNGFTDNDYSEFNGTSAACPNAAGVMALILSEDSTLTETEAREILSRTAEQTGGYLYDQAMDYGWWADEMGYGRVNAFKALQYMNSTADIQESERIELYYDNGDPILMNSTTGSFEIYDSKGALICQFNSTQNNVSLSNYIRTKGIYLIRISGSPNSEKFIIQ